MVDFLREDIAIHKRQMEAYRRQTRRLWVILISLTVILATTVIYGAFTVNELSRKHDLVIERLTEVQAVAYRGQYLNA